MRAAILNNNGAIDSLRIGEIEPPKLAPGAILVRVRAASINPADLKVIRGKDGGGFLLSSLNETFDVFLDAAATTSYGEVKGLLNRGGAYVTLLPSASVLGGMLLSLFSSKRCSFVTVQSRAADLDQLAAWIVAGQLKASVEKTFPLSEIGFALSALDSGSVRGKVAVRIDG